LDATAASIQYSYMITIDAVIELSDLVEDWEWWSFKKG
jgi:hypothetical protein